MAKKKAKKKPKRESIEEIIEGVPKRWVELVGSRIDGRTTEGRNAWIALRAYNQKGNTKKRALLEGLLVSFDGRFMDIVYADPVDYQEGVDARCTCGEGLKNPYLMRVSGRTVREGKESQIIAKIRDAKSLSTQTLRAKGLFFLGRVCYEDITGLLSYFGEDIGGRHAKTRKKKSDEAEQTALDVSDELRERLSDLGINEEQFQKIHYFIKDASDLSEISSLLYEFDFGKNRSLGNWFREGIHAPQPTIKNPEIVEVFHRLRRAPKSITTEDLAALVTYSYEHRSFESRAVIGSVRDDLEYLSGLDNSNPLIRRFGRFNIDKAYVRPHTRFRERKKNPDKGKTIREKMNEDKLSFLEAIGVGLHFSKVKDRKKDRVGDLEYVRIEANRETADKYGVGRHWDYILKELKPVFEGVKAELAKDYAKFGKVVREHVLTRDEYNLAKRFFNKSGMGRGTERENYLRMISIRQFRDIAPKIVAIGRKVRYARRLYDKTGDEELKDNALRQEYFTREELTDRFEALTGIQEHPDQIIALLTGAQFVKGKSFGDFQAKQGALMADMYRNGLMAKRFLSGAQRKKGCQLKRFYDALKKEKVEEVTEGKRDRLTEIIKWKNTKINGRALVEYAKPNYSDPIFDVSLKGPEGSYKTGIFLPEKASGHSEFVFWRLYKLLKEVGFHESDRAQLKEDFKTLAKAGRVTYIGESEYGSDLSKETYDLDRMRLISEDFSVYHISKIQKAANKLRNSVEVDEEFMSKLGELSNSRDLREAGVEQSFGVSSLTREDDTPVYVSATLKDQVEDAYGKLQEYKQSPRGQSLNRRRENWPNTPRHKREELADSLGQTLYSLVKDDPQMWEVINGAVGGYLRGPHGWKSLVRKPEYAPQIPRKWAELTFKRFLGNGTKPVDMYALAGGRAASFKLDAQVRGYLDEDLAKRRITQAQHAEYSGRMDQFEANANKAIQEWALSLGSS